MLNNANIHNEAMLSPEICKHMANVESVDPLTGERYKKCLHCGTMIVTKQKPHATRVRK